MTLLDVSTTIKMDSTTLTRGTDSNYTDRGSRISKDNLFMVLALWMEQFPVEDSDSQEADAYRKVGAVLVLPNDMLHAVDCSRDGVHGITRLLTKHYDVTKDCKIFVSRKPCSLCTKLLVQCKIKRVFYLPIEPEYKEDFEEETSRVDDLFKTSSIGQSVFVPTVGTDVIANAEKKRETPQKIRDDKKKKLLELYWKDKWIKKAKDSLPWPAFDDNMKGQVLIDFQNLMEWMARILIEEKKGYMFQRRESSQSTSHNGSSVPFDPSAESEQAKEKKLASFLITMARFLAERSDDPNTGVGAVITNPAFEIVALGWNGFPTKAFYGEFPRASHDDQVKRKKYPFTIHAEQNALLLHNTKNLANGILFVTKTPCNECTPLLAMEGIKTVVLGEEMKAEKAPSTGTLGYEKFLEQVRKGTFICFEMRRLNRWVDHFPRNQNLTRNYETAESK